jgi:hypothetical protein
MDFVVVTWFKGPLEATRSSSKFVAEAALLFEYSTPRFDLTLVELNVVCGLFLKYELQIIVGSHVVWGSTDQAVVHCVVVCGDGSWD